MAEGNDTDISTLMMSRLMSNSLQFYRLPPVGGINDVILSGRGTSIHP